MPRPKKPGAKGMCRVCHHRADQHYPTPPAEQKLEAWQEPNKTPWCHHPLGGGSLCGCAGLGSGGSYDKKRSRA